MWARTSTSWTSQVGGPAFGSCGHACGPHIACCGPNCPPWASGCRPAGLCGTFARGLRAMSIVGLLVQVGKSRPRSTRRTSWRLPSESCGRRRVWTSPPLATQCWERTGSRSGAWWSGGRTVAQTGRDGRVPATRSCSSSSTVVAVGVVVALEGLPAGVTADQRPKRQAH
jgi:hypothetical protein